MIKVLGMGNALVDIITRIDDDRILKDFGLPRGSMTLVDLDTGKRNDLIFSPGVGALTVFAMDLNTYGLDPSKKWLVLFGVGMVPGVIATIMAVTAIVL